jgi:hypothetical protein
MAEIADVLAERRKTHGDYSDHARVTQALKRVMEGENGWARLNDCQREALAIIAHKVGRILSGNPDFADHWVDIGGYAKLVADRIAEQDRITQSWADAAVTITNTPRAGESQEQAQARARGHEPLLTRQSLDQWSTSGLRAQLIDLGRSPPSPVGEALRHDIRAELERRERRPGSADDGGHHARQDIVPEGGAFDMKVGDRIICDTPGHTYYGRAGVAKEFLQDGDAYVQLDGEQGYTMIKWNHLSKAPGAQHQSFPLNESERQGVDGPRFPDDGRN